MGEDTEPAADVIPEGARRPEVFVKPVGAAPQPVQVELAAEPVVAPTIIGFARTEPLHKPELIEAAALAAKAQFERLGGASG